MISFNVDVYKTLKQLGIVEYAHATIKNAAISVHGGLELEVTTETGSVYDIKVAISDVVFHVDTKKIMMNALESFNNEPNTDSFNALVKAGQHHFEVK